MPPVAFQLPPQTPAVGKNAPATPAQRLFRKPATNQPGANSFNQQLNKVTARQSQEEAPAKAERNGPTEKPSRTDRPTKKAKAAESTRKAHKRDEEEADEADVAEGEQAKNCDATAVEQVTDETSDGTESESAEAEAKHPSADETPIDPALLQLGAAQATAVQPENATTDGSAAVDRIDGVAGEAAEVVTLDGQAASTPTTSATGGDDLEEAIAGEQGKAKVGATGPSGKPSTGVSGLGAKASDPARTQNADDADQQNDESTSEFSGESASSTAKETSTTAIEQFAELFAPASDPKHAVSEKPAAEPSASPISAIGNGTQQPESTAGTRSTANPVPADAPPLDTEARFAATNHAKIVSDVRGALMPNGGTMQLRLDPPELGAMQVSLHIKEGIVTASFQTQNPEAARLLSHTLGDLRSSLEAQGVVVDKLHVQQAPKDQGAGNNAQGGDRQNQGLEQQQDSKREQQRKEMVQRLWDQLAGNAPIDFMA